MEVAQGEYFYDETGLLGQPVENALCRIEGRFEGLLRQLLFLDRSKELPWDLVSYLAQHFAIMRLRTMSVREELLEMQSKIGQMLVDDLVSRNEPDMQGKMRFVLDRELASTIHNDFFFNELTVKNLAEHLYYRHVWLFAHNNTPRLLYTADTAMAHVSCSQIKSFLQPECATLLGELVFPISPRHVVRLLRRDLFPNHQPFHRLQMELSEDHVCRLNESIVRNSRRQVFAQDDRFELAEEVCKKHPECCDPNRERAVSRLVRNGDSSLHLLIKKS